MALGQFDGANLCPLFSMPMRERLSGMLPAAVGVGIKRQIDGSHSIAQLTKLVCVELSSHGTGNVVKTSLPQHGVVKQPFDQNDFWVSTDVVP